VAVRLCRLISVVLLAAAVHAPVGAQTRPTDGDEPGQDLTAAEAAARLFGTVADTSRFLEISPGALDSLATRIREHDGRPLVVVQYGDSHTQAGILPRELRDQFAGGSRASPGFVAPGLHNLGDASVVTLGHWKKKNWLKAEDAGSFGPLGAAWTTHDLHSRAVLHLSQVPPPGTMVTALFSNVSGHPAFWVGSNGVVLRQEAAAPPSRDPDHPQLGTVRVTMPPGATALDLGLTWTKRPGPDFRFFGFVVEEPGAAIEWDALGITGTSVEHPLQRGDHTMEEYLTWRHPDLVVVWFGSNSLVAAGFDPASYQKDYSAFLARLAAAAPGASRLAIGPPDLARRPASCPNWYGHQKHKLSAHDRALLPRYVCAPETTIVHRPGHADVFPVRTIHSTDDWRGYIEKCSPQTLPTVATSTDAERNAARANGYAFFDTFSFMDGPGSIHRWACQTPRLAAYDLVHLTADGYSTLAQGVWGALPRAIRNPGIASNGGGATLQMAGGRSSPRIR
jgi:lysophospholipase L1-like esterase